MEILRQAVFREQLDRVPIESETDSEEEVERRMRLGYRGFAIQWWAPDIKSCTLFPKELPKLEGQDIQITRYPTRCLTDEYLSQTENESVDGSTDDEEPMMDLD